MKRTLLLTALSAALLFSGNIQAQSIPGVSKVTKMLPKVDLGVKVGANFQTLSGNGLASSYNGGVVGGLFVGVHKNKMGVQVEGLIKTVKYSFNSGTDYNTISLDVPVMFEYKIFWHIWAQAGPQFSTIISAHNGDKNVKDQFNTTDFAGLLGLEAHLPGHINAGVRYILGVTNVNNESASGVSGSWNNRSIQAYVGFRFL